MDKEKEKTSAYPLWHLRRSLAPRKESYFWVAPSERLKRSLGMHTTFNCIFPKILALHNKVLLNHQSQGPAHYPPPQCGPKAQQKLDKKPSSHVTVAQQRPEQDMPCEVICQSTKSLMSPAARALGRQLADGKLRSRGEQVWEGDGLASYGRGFWEKHVHGENSCHPSRVTSVGQPMTNNRTSWNSSVPLSLLS